jgi:hypothetical protein
MINFELIIVSIILCLLYGLFHCRDSERPTLKRFIYASLIAAVFFFALGLAIYFGELLFFKLPFWLAISVPVLMLGVIIISFCRGIIQELVEEGKPITGFYLIFTILCVLVVTWVLVSSEVIPTWFGWTLTVLLGIDRCVAFFIYRHDKRLHEAKKQKDD